MFLHKTFRALNGRLCADVPLRNYSLTASSALRQICVTCCSEISSHLLTQCNSWSPSIRCHSLTMPPTASLKECLLYLARLREAFLLTTV